MPATARPTIPTPRAALGARPPVAAVESHRRATPVLEAVRHEVSMVERGPFTQPVCSCGWAGTGRRSRPAARDEGRSHVVPHSVG